MQRMTALVLMAVLLAGCGTTGPAPKSATPPASTATTTTLPADPKPAGTLVDLSVNLEGMRGFIPIANGATTIVGPNALTVSLPFKEGVDKQAVVAALRVEGGELTREWQEGDGALPQLNLRAPAGPSGSWKITLPNVRLEGRSEAGVSFTILRGKAADQSVTAGGRPLAQFADFLKQPTEIAVTFSVPVDKASVEAAIREQHEEHWQSKENPAAFEFTWASDRELKVFLANPPERVKLSWLGAKDAAGSPLWTEGYYLTFGNSRSLVKASLPGGQSQMLQTLSIVTNAGSLSPRKDKIALVEVLDSSYKNFPVHILDLHSGTLSPTDVRVNASADLAWSPDGRLSSRQLVCVASDGSSPDGRYTARVETAPYTIAELEAANRHWKAEVIIREKATGKEHRVPIMMRVGLHGPVGPGLVWSRDSQKLAFFSVEKDRTMTVFSYDLASGKQTPLGNVQPAGGSATGWSPNGEALLYMGYLFREGRTPVAIGMDAHADAWSPDGRYLLLTPQRQGDSGQPADEQLVLYDVLTGSARDFVRGRHLGWLEDGAALVLQGHKGDLRGFGVYCEH